MSMRHSFYRPPSFCFVVLQKIKTVTLSKLLINQIGEMNKRTVVGDSQRDVFVKRKVDYLFASLQSFLYMSHIIQCNKRSHTYHFMISQFVKYWRT